MRRLVATLGCAAVIGSVGLVVAPSAHAGVVECTERMVTDGNVFGGANCMFDTVGICTIYFDPWPVAPYDPVAEVVEYPLCLI